jgi:hypothetical protein
VRTKQKAAVLVEQRLARDRTEAYRDARALAIELARAEPSLRFDPMRAGVVLKPGETVYRQGAALDPGAAGRKVGRRELGRRARDGPACAVSFRLGMPHVALVERRRRPPSRLGGGADSARLRRRPAGQLLGVYGRACCRRRDRFGVCNGCDAHASRFGPVADDCPTPPDVGQTS